MVYSVAASAMLTVVANGRSATVSADGAWPPSTGQRYGKCEFGRSVCFLRYHFALMSVATGKKAAIGELVPVATKAPHTQHLMQVAVVGSL